MKKILMAVMLFCGVLTGFAQSGGDLRFGVTGGMNVANITDAEADCRIGFNIGGRVEYNFSESFFMTSGLLLTQKGCTSEYEEMGLNMEETANPLYLQIPVHFGGRYSLGNGVSIFGETGPYFAFGVGGKYKVEASYGGKSKDDKVNFFDQDGTNVFDFGWGLRAGVEVSNIQIHLGYEYGFTKVFDGGGHNSNFMVGLTYYF